MIYTHVAAALVAAILAGWTGWSVQGWRLGEQISKIKEVQSQAFITAIEGARIQERAAAKGIQDAQAIAIKSAQASKVAAAAARTESRSLRDDLAAARALSSESLSACNQHAATVDRLFDQCGERYTGMAETAQGHARDVRMLLDSWVK